jgi:hypothetical protein
MNCKKAINDLCEAVNNMDDVHQQQAFVACLGIILEKLK